MNTSNTKTTFSRADLKWIAAVSMVLDHMGCVFISQQTFPVLYYLLRLMGRVSFPIICFLLVQGIGYTKNKSRYISRLFAFALISEIPYDLVFYGKLVHIGAQNVLFTLFIGLGVLFIIEKINEKKEDSIIKSALTVLAGMALAYFLRVDYSFWGILMILAFYLGQYQTKERQRFILIIICALQGILQLFASAALVFTENYNPDKKGKIPNSFFYFFYPIHLFILWLL